MFLLCVLQWILLLHSRAEGTATATNSLITVADRIIPLPPKVGWKARAKCGLREYFFQDRKCPWNFDHAQAVELKVGGILRVQTKPESCWYDANRYALKYVDGENGSVKHLLVHADGGRELSVHPQCHLSMQLTVLSYHSSNGGDRSPAAFQGVLSTSLEEAPKDKWSFVKPSAVVGPYDDLDSIKSFDTITEKDTDPGKLEMGPDIDKTGNIIYTPNGLPSYLHISDPENNQAPTYCGNKYSKTTRWIQFKTPGTFMVAYKNIHIGQCAMDVSYDLEGLTHMLNIDRWILVHVQN